MSRSVKKHPWYKTSGFGGQSYAKRQANRHVRRSLDDTKGCYYKRIYPQWLVHDQYMWLGDMPEYQRIIDGITRYKKV